MPEQIFFELPASGVGPKVSDEEVSRFICWLSGRGWVRRQVIETQTEWEDRIIRALAAASRGHVITSQLGYRLNCQASPPERDACLRRLRGERDKLTRRIKDTMNVSIRGLIPECLR